MLKKLFLLSLVFVSFSVKSAEQSPVDHEEDYDLESAMSESAQQQNLSASMVVIDPQAKYDANPLISKNEVIALLKQYKQEIDQHLSAFEKSLSETFDASTFKQQMAGLEQVLAKYQATIDALGQRMNESLQEEIQKLNARVAHQVQEMIARSLGDIQKAQQQQAVSIAELQRAGQRIDNDDEQGCCLPCFKWCKKPKRNRNVAL